MPVPIVYRTSGGLANATYDWIDVAGGVGIVKFYGGSSADSGGTKYILTRNTPYTTFTAPAAGTVNRLNCTRVSANETANTKIIDLDFDTLALNLPQTLKGTMLSMIPLSADTDDSNNSYRGNGYVIVDLKKVAVGGAETSIVSTTSINFIWMDDPGINNGTDYLTIQSTVPTTLIKKGEKIRITVELWNKKTATLGGGFLMCYDPLNPAIAAAAGTSGQARCSRTAGYSAMEFLIPFRIDL